MPSLRPVHWIPKVLQQSHMQYVYTKIPESYLGSHCPSKIFGTIPIGRVMQNTKVNTWNWNEAAMAVDQEFALWQWLKSLSYGNGSGVCHMVVNRKCCLNLDHWVPEQRNASKCTNYASRGVRIHNSASILRASIVIGRIHIWAHPKRIQKMDAKWTLGRKHFFCL